MLRPGDALYLPRGFLHSAVAQGEVSIHLTVGVHPVTAYDLARELIAAAAADRELRRSLPLGVDVTDPAAMREHVRAAAASDWPRPSTRPARRTSTSVASSGRPAAGRRDQAGAARPAWPNSPRCASCTQTRRCGFAPACGRRCGHTGDRLAARRHRLHDQLAGAGRATRC